MLTHKDHDISRFCLPFWIMFSSEQMQLKNHRYPIDTKKTCLTLWLELWPENGQSQTSQTSAGSMMTRFVLTQCGLVASYGDINLSQHWLGNGLLPNGTKPLLEVMLTYHQRCFVAFTNKPFLKQCWLIIETVLWHSPISISQVLMKLIP